MMNVRVVFPLCLSIAAAAAACRPSVSRMNGSAAPGSGNYANAAPAMAPGILNADPDDVWSALFHDDFSNVDLAQVLAWDDSSHTGVFISVPASMVAAAGSYTIDSTMPNVFSRFGVSTEGDNGECDRQWMFALNTGTLVVTSPAAQPGDTLAVVVDNATFVFVDEHGHMNGAVSANLGSTNSLGSLADGDPIYEP